MKLYLLITIAALVLVEYVYAVGESCVNHSKEKGICEAITKCPSIDAMYKKYLSSRQDRNSYNILIANMKSCGDKVQGKDIVVCCQELAAGTRSDKGPAKLNLPECGRSKVDDSDRVIGGKNAKEGAWPWMALIGYDSLDSIFNCGGSIISIRHILTAAHCVTRKISFVRLGEHDLSTSSEAKHIDIKIQDFKKHERYDPKYKLRDIAILTLEKDIEFSDTIAPICLPLIEPFRSEKHIKTSPFIAGWGKTDDAGKRPNILQEVRIVVESNEKCEEGFMKVNKKLVTIAQQFDDSVLCAGFRGKDSCQGDSGGPLMTPERDSKKKTVYYQIGIVSYGIGCALEDVPGIYTSVQYFVDWIKKQVEG